MSRISVICTIVAVVILQITVVVYAVMYGRHSATAPVSMIELSQPGSQISPKWIAIADPNQKTVSVVMVGIGEKISTSVFTVTPYNELSK